MKIFYTFIAFLMLSTILFAQTPITITTADMPSTNDTIRYSLTNNIQGQDPTLTGANYVWDYTALTPNSQRIDTFFSVTSTPVAYQFYFNNNIMYPTHKANYALRGQDFVMPPALPIPLSITNVFNFIKNSSSKYENVGFGSKISGIPSSTRNIPTDVEYVFPLNYTDSNFSSSEYLISIPTLAAYGQSMDRTTTVEGWGQLNTPFGSFNVVKVKSVLMKVDTLFLDTLGFGFTFPRPVEIEYKWLANNMNTPVLTVITTAGVVTTIQYQDSARVVGIEELQAMNGLAVFPNPTKDVVFVTFNSKVSGKLNYVIKDITGNVVSNESSLAYPGKNIIKVSMDKQTFKPGVYFLEFELNNQITSKKIVFSE